MRSDHLSNKSREFISIYYKHVLCLKGFEMRLLDECISFEIKILLS